MVNDKEIPMGRYKSNDQGLKEKDNMVLGKMISLRGAVLHTFKDKNPANKIALEYRINEGELTIEKEGGGYETANLMVLTGKYFTPLKDE